MAATAAQTISRMIVVSARRDHSRIEPKCTARCNSLPFAALQLQPARIRTPRRVNTSRSPAAIDAKSMRGPAEARCTTLGTPSHGSGPGSAEKRSFSCLGAAKWSLVNKAPRRPQFILVHTSHGPGRLLVRSVRLRLIAACRLHRAFGRARRRIARQRSSISIIAANDAICNVSCAVDRPT